MRCMYLVVCSMLGMLLVGCTQTQSPNPSEMGMKDNVQSTEGNQGMEGSSITAENVQDQLAEAGAAIGKYSSQTAAQFMEGTKGSLDQLKQKADQLQSEIAGLDEEAQSQIKQSVDDLKAKLKEAQQQFSNLHETSGDAWTKSKDDLQAAMKNLKTAYQQAVDTFQKARTSKSGSGMPAGNSGNGM